MNDRVTVPGILKELAGVFTGKGYSVYLVGGAVRDLFLGKTATDWDIATNATPQEVSALFKRVIPTGIEHGTVTIPFRGNLIECTTFRTETGYSDGRRPDSIAYTATIEEDLARRDFTMNAIAVSLPEGIITDPFQGRNDIRAGIIRTVGIAADRFGEDGLRPLRAVRFSSQLGFRIEDDTLSAIGPALGVTAQVAIERARDEFRKILESPVPSRGLRLMESTGLMDLFLPELMTCRGITQKGQHRHDVLDHLYEACDYASPQALDVRLAALLHDIGKPASRAVDAAGNYTFHNHETISAKIAATILERFRLPLKFSRDVVHLIEEHMFHYESSWTDAAVRRFIVRVGEEYLDRLFALRLADTAAIAGNDGLPPYLPELAGRIDALRRANHAFSLKDLELNGRDLIEAGIPAGPSTGKILKELLETVLDDPSLNTKDRLREIALAIYAEKF